MSRKLLIIILSVLVIIGITGSIIALVLPRQTPPQTTHESPVDLFDTSMKEVVARELSKSEQRVEASDLIITKRKDVDDTWVIMTMINKKQPLESEARNMTYVVKVEGQGLQLAAFSGDSFSQESFREPVDDKIIQEANTL